MPLPVQSSKLLLALASTVNLGFGIFFFCHNFYVSWNGTSSSTRGGVWLLLVTPRLLGSILLAHSVSQSVSQSQPATRPLHWLTHSSSMPPPTS
jgi:hypothetical protein